MKKKKGQAVLEVALVMPVIIIIFCGMIDIGRILQVSANLNMVSQEAVRLAGLGRNDTDVAQYVKDKSSISDKDSITVNVTPHDYQRKSGDYVTITITYPVKYITPLVNVFLSSSFMVSTQSTIRVE